MCKKTKASVTFLLLLISFFVIKTNAEEIIPQEKQALIKELLDVTETKKMLENITNMMLLQMEQNYPRMMSQVMHEVESLSAEKEEKFQKEFIESQLRFSKRFRELYPQRIDLQEVITQVYYPLYNKYFAENELQDLIAFYRSPTGKKVLNITPQLMQESMQKSSELLNPKIIQLVNEVLKEEKARLLEIKEKMQNEE